MKFIKLSTHRLLVIAALLISTATYAETYNFRNNLPPGCSQSGNNPAQCPNGLRLGWNDRLVPSSINEVIVNGDVNLRNADVYWQESSRLIIRASGDIVIENDARVNAELFADDDVSIGSRSQLLGSVDAGDEFNTNSNVEVTGDISAGEMYLGYNSDFSGLLTAEDDIETDSDVRINGSVIAGGDVALGNDSRVTGNLSGENVRLNSSNARVDGNVVANDDLVLEWRGSIGGDATAINIRNDSGSYGAVGGTPYCQTSNGSQPLQCQTQSAPADLCEVIPTLSDYAIVALDSISIGFLSGVNGNSVQGPSNGNAILPNGTLEQLNISFPPLTPSAFPSFSTNNDRNNPSNLPPGTYDDIRLNGGNPGASTQGGTYYIDHIRFQRDGAVLQLAPGDYYINRLDISDNSAITISPSGPVRLFIGDYLNAGNYVSINGTGATSDLQVLMYPNADLGMGSSFFSGGLNFNGFIYAPYDDNTITFNAFSQVRGSVFTAGDFALGGFSGFTNTSADRTAVNEAFGCSQTPDQVHHYRLLHPESLVSCLAAPIKIIPCLDANCASRFTEAVSITLQSSANGSQFGNGGNTTFTGGEGVLGLNYVAGGATSISVNSAIPTPQNPTQCFDSSGTIGTDCSIDFRTAGLIFTASDGTSAIPPSFAGEDFNALVRAVETNTETGACEARLTGPQPLELAASCRNPLTCQAAQSFIVNGNAVPLNNANAALNFATVPVTFDANGGAPLNITYSDVGAMRLHGQITLSESPNNSEPAVNDPNVTLNGTSVNDFVVKPHTLSVIAVDSGDQPVSATTNSGAAFASAGENFSLVVSARNADGNVTPNFGRETPASEVQTNYVQTLYPASASAPASDYSGDQGFALDPNRPGSLRTDSARWSDVGTIEISPALTNNSYLGAGDVAVKQNTSVGRFAPFRFAIDSSSVTNSCVPGDYTYMSEPALNVIYQLYAVDSDGNVTENYNAADYAGTAQVDVVAANLSPADNSSDRFADRLINLPTQQSWSAGILNFTTGSAGFARHPDGIIDGPFASLQLGLQITSEIDNRNFAASDLDLSTVSGDAASLNGMLQLRYGRFVIENTYGPETEDLSVPLRAEFFDGSRFITHVADSCTTAQVSALAVLSDPANLNPSAIGSDTTLVDGVVPFNSLRWQATGIGNVGEFIYEYDAPAWLEFNWLDDSGSSYQDPRGIAGFGQYRGNPRVLYWKELN